MQLQFDGNEENGNVGQRLDVAVSQSARIYSRATIIKLIKQGSVLVNGSVKPSSYHIREGDQIILTGPDNEQAEIDLPIIYEDGNVIVIDKPAGALTHSKGTFNREGTVASFIATKISPELRESNRGGIVHRLDRDTSGIIICAKNEATQKYLQKQFSERTTKKQYVALVEGTLKDPEAILKWPIGRNPKRPQTFRVDANGKAAETNVKVLEQNKVGNVTLVQLTPKTGRTHQLRVHMEHLGNPIIGDKLYGKPAERLWLHAERLELTLPGGKRRVFTSKLPDGFFATLHKAEG